MGEEMAKSASPTTACAEQAFVQVVTLGIGVLVVQFKKVIYLAIQETPRKWTMPIRNWKAALNRFMIEFEDRLVDFV